ncbi:hypothetical protein [Azotosporobacter soli]|uniref:AsmA family protein n=1 Tax=Azotosporobacter soli TaxID=3055040 RepID=UPI0031FECAB7
MDEERAAATDLRTKWSKKKISMLVLAAFFLTGVLLFQWTAGKIRQAATEVLLVQANEAVTGQIVVGSLDLSILGSVQAKAVEVIDSSGKTLAKIERVQLRYNWNDLRKGKLGPQLIQGITLEKPEIWVVYRQGQLNWTGLLKPTSKEETGFVGGVKVQEGKLHLESDVLTQSVEQLNGEIDVRQGSQVGLAAVGKVEQAEVRLDGQWDTQGDSELTLLAKGVEMAKLGLTAEQDPIRITDGKLTECSVKIGKDNLSGAMLVKTLSGRFSGVTTTGALALTQGGAKFEKQGEAILFSEGEALYQGQSVTTEGRVTTMPSGEQVLDFSVQMPDADPAAMLPDLQTGGRLTAQGKISGSVFSPLLSGNFTLGSLQFGDKQISNIHGGFSYAKETLQLLGAQGNMSGGSVAASGVVYPLTAQYNLTLSGNGLDTAQLTKKDVSGPLSMTGTAVGSNAAATMQGSFTIYNGTAYGIAFRTITGNFIKRGAAEVEVSNLAIKTDFGVFYPEQLSQDVMETLRSRNLPSSGAELREQVTEKVKEKVTNKLLGNFLH